MGVGERGFEAGVFRPLVEAVPGGEGGGDDIPRLADEVLAAFAEEAGVGAVDEGEASVGLVAADEVGLVLDDGAVARLALLQAAGHLLDFAGEAEDVVGLVFGGGVGAGIGAGGAGGGGGGVLVDLLDLGDERAVEDVTGEHEEDAADQGKADDPVGVTEALAEVFVGGDDDQGGGETGGQAQDEHGLAAKGYLHRPTVGRRAR